MTLAFVFPGQGSQKLGMLSDFSETDIVRQTFEEASNTIDKDLWALCQQGEEAALNQTENTQPVLLTASVALWRLWQAKSDHQPQALAGHSLGEYSALVCAGVIDLPSAVQLVQLRGQLMQKAVSDVSGKMAAIIGLDDEKVIAACEQAADDRIVSAVNFNSPGQVVIAGEASAVDDAMHLCKEQGAKRALPLPVSVPSHCALMKPAADELASFVENVAFDEPKIEVINNVDVKYEVTVDKIKNALVRQLYNPVRWTETILLLTERIDNFVECGPGNVLSGLGKRIHKASRYYQLGQHEQFESTLNELNSI